MSSRYRIVGEAFGRGAGALVYRAYDRVREQDVALKQLLLPAADGVEPADSVAMFEREYHTLAQLRHPNIIQVHDYGAGEGLPYYTMELLDGVELRELGRLPPQRAGLLLRQVASALALLHARRLVHRDLSFRNVFCTEQGAAKLIDFGSMLPMGQPEDAAGTPPFVSPEGLRGEALDGRADLFALGALGYFMLVGRHAYPARHLNDLPEVWRSRPHEPHQLEPTVSRALSELVMSLLHLDRSRRPASAAEVAERLTACCDLPPEDHAAISQAHLAVPKLIGRERTLLDIRKRVLRMAQGTGIALLVEGEAGLGRSRLLDSCVLEGQVVGALALRVDAAHNRAGDYALVRALCREALQLHPERALQAARPHGAVLGHVLPELWERLGKPELQTFPTRYEQRPAFQRALRAFFIALADRRPLMIAVDDIHRADEPSMSVLALLARAIVQHRVALCVSVPPAHDGDQHAAIALLRQCCEMIQLAPLRDSETRALVESILGRVAGVSALADQLHRLSEGNPGMCLTLLQHLIDRGLLQHGEGGWVIPPQIDERALPQTVADACRAQFAALGEDARELAQALSLCEGEISLADYLALTSHGERKRMYAALDELVMRQVLVGSGRVYGFRHVGMAAAARESLSVQRRAGLELRVAHVLQARGVHVVVVAYHLLRAREAKLAAALLLEMAIKTENAPLVLDPVALPYARATYERAIAECRSHKHPPADTVLLEISVVGLSMFVDPTLSLRYGPVIEQTLQEATGLTHWNDPEVPSDPLARLGHCLDRAQAEWNARPEAERGLAPLKAIEALGRYVLYALAPRATMIDVAGIKRLIELIAPLVPLAPALAVIHDIAEASHDIALALDRRAEQRFLRVIARVAEPDGAGLPGFVQKQFRLAALYALCLSRAFCSDPRLPTWISELDGDPLQQANAFRMRRHAHMMRGEPIEARRCAERIEALTLENSGLRTLDGGTAYADFRVAVLSGDLGELKQAVAVIDQLGERYPMYAVLKHCALGVYQAACGNLESARRELERGLASMQPDTHVAWGTSTDDYLWLRHELDGAEVVAPLCEQALRRAERVPLDLRPTSSLRALLALCEAELGEGPRALTRIRELLGECAEYGLAPLQMSIVHYRAARTALAAGDPAMFEHCARQYAALCKQDGFIALLSRYEALMQLAHGSSVEVAPELDGLVGNSTQRLGGRRVRGQLRRALSVCSGSRQRVACALRWLVQRTNAAEGYFYVVANGEPRLLQSTSSEAPSREIEALVRGELEAARSYALYTSEPSGIPSMLPPRADGHRALVIEQRVDGEPRVTAVIALRDRGPQAPQIASELVRAIEVELDPDDLIVASA